MKKTKTEIVALAKDLSAEAGRAVNPDEVTGILADFDEAAATAELKSNYRTEIWDRVSSINGVPAEDVLSSRDDIPEGGEVYLVYQGDTVLLFQPFVPGEEGFKPMTKAVAETASKKQVDSLVAPEVEARAMSHLRRGIGISKSQRLAKFEKDEEFNRRVEAEVNRRVQAHLDSIRSQMVLEETERILREGRQ